MVARAVVPEQDRSLLSDATVSTPEPSDKELRRAAAWEWRARYVFERQAMARFERLSLTLRQHGVSEALVELAAAAARDERRHAELCRELVAYLGAELGDVPTVGDQACAPAGLQPDQALIYEMVAMSCVTETLSCVLLGEMVERCDDPHVQSTMRTILRDEVGHSRLGWGYLAEIQASGAQTFIGPYLPQMLAGTVGDELFSTAQLHPLAARLGGLGALSRPERLRVFVASMREVVFPGLERFGIDTSAAQSWLAERQGETSAGVDATA
jgi:hypothetical protein